MTEPKILNAGNGDEPLGNYSANEHFDAVLARFMKRRALLKGTLAASIGAMFGGLGAAAQSLAAAGAATSAKSLLGFAAVPVSNADKVIVPKGYKVQVLIPWGTPLTPDAPAFDPLKNTGADQARQVGMHHDGMHFFPIEGKSPFEGSSSEGLLVLNHEYIEPRFMHASAVGKALDSDAVVLKDDGKRAAQECLKELNAHGVSVVHIRRQADGSWAPVIPSRFNRRITGLTPMEIAGPVRGSDFVKTKYSPDGTHTRGTLNNCAMGVTPWNTYLTCEENWAGYFYHHVAKKDLPREQARYGVRHAESKPASSRYAWERADNGADEFVRFNVTALGADATQDYRNEANTFGWVVEIDPFDPTSTPIKRTALGRFAHEGVVFQPAQEGKPVVCYSGDDARHEYIYKYVSKGGYRAAAGKENAKLLDEGTLYVAKFNDDGTGEWLPLVFGQGPLVAPHFTSQADVLVNTRSAADALGATKMDRPEWGAVCPRTRMVYFTLTNNTRREVADQANPRVKNKHGHIIRWREANDDPTATRFTWDIFVLCGDEKDSQLAGKPLSAEQILSSPDGLWFDRDGRLWIQTDMSESVLNQGEFAVFGNNQMLCADPASNEMKRFLVGPIGQEITGVTATPDGKTMFINVQHPGATTKPEEFAAGKLKSHWPHDGARYPRSATVVITKEDGGVIGT